MFRARTLVAFGVPLQPATRPGPAATRFPAKYLACSNYEQCGAWLFESCPFWSPWKNALSVVLNGFGARISSGPITATTTRAIGCRRRYLEEYVP